MFITQIIYKEESKMDQGTPIASENELTTSGAEPIHSSIGTIEVGLTASAQMVSDQVLEGTD